MSKQDKPKMATSWEIYNRIIWDSRLDSNVFIAGFEDRVSASGIREKPLAHWAADGDIPWHRIRYIRAQDIVVWDREQHLDLISSGHLPAFAWNNNQADETDKSTSDIKEQPATFSTKPVYKYKVDGWQAIDYLSKSVKSNSLTVASFNVLCDVYEKEKIQTEKRLPVIVEELRKCDADIIAIQEATPDFVRFLLAQDWVRDYYVSESSTAENIQTFANLLLSRLPYTLVEHKFSAHKHVLVGSWFINSELLQVAAVHLTSNRAQNADKKRKYQLTTVVDYLRKQPGNYFIVGDFNTRNNLQEQVPDISSFVDVWQDLRPDEAGYTFNPQLNPLAELMSLAGEAARFDRILMCSEQDSWVPQSVDLFAIEPVDNTEEKIFPSDHFGIRAVVENLTPPFRAPLSLSRRREENLATPLSLSRRREEENLTPPFRAPLSLSRRREGNLATPLSLSRRREEENLTPPLSRRGEENLATPLYLTRRGEGGEVIRDELKTIAPVYQSAIVIIPPEDIVPAIQTIRQRYDARFERWMPHINLIYGFLPESYFDEAAEIITSAVAQIQPFTVNLNNFETFTHRKSSTAWLHPIAQPETALHQLQALLQSLFPQCNEQSRKSDAGFTPHLSVGQFSTPEEAFAKLPQWHPRSFTVKSIALISRRGNEAFEVRRIIDLGAEASDIIPSELINLVNQLQPKLNQAQQIQRDTVLEIVSQACKECLGFQPNLQLLGSYRLGVESPESDLDVVCQIPTYLSGDDFLKNVQQRLKGLCESIQLVLDAKVPLLRLKLEGISLDLLYTGVDKNWASGINPKPTKSEMAIIGCWEADFIREFVQEYVPFDSFQWLLRAVRAWAKSRRIYGNNWGFLGGLSWALLSAWSCQYCDKNHTQPDKLLANFFNHLNQYNWRQPIALTDAGKQYSVQVPRDLLPIITSIEPCQNTARNITRSTAEILSGEFARATEMTQEIAAGNLDWSSLFEPINLQQESDIFLNLKLIGNDKQQLEKECGYLEGYIISLIIQLENHGIFVRPWAEMYRIQNAASIRLGLKIPLNLDLSLIKELARDFMSQYCHDFEVET
ncbi:poly(A) polymerase [Rivularia sp. PCC 7116]|uniref:poly(A) polymerase n=1 Tax=Rivularia sp. PCC 7116 TaxID=373994 RepID=UPI00029F20B4|nr:poly(A) polymerase [Rivularia sp. PCC 7116]AFY57962.1 poly(A) polymerase [Rivularia sp. PCC 7116]